MIKKMNKKGFTIVELVIVIAVIAILAGVMIPVFGSVIEDANESKAVMEAKNAYTILYAEDVKDGEIQTSLTDGTYTFGLTDGVLTSDRKSVV